MGDKVREAAHVAVVEWEEWFDGGKERYPLEQAMGKLAEALAAPPQEQAPGWMPIDGAPKDGTEVLAWRDDCGAFIASYTSADAFSLTQDEIDSFESEEALFSKDWFTQWPSARRLEGSEVPTHYMPLPAAPSQEQAKGRV